MAWAQLESNKLFVKKLGLGSNNFFQIFKLGLFKSKFGGTLLIKEIKKNYQK